MSGAQAGPRIGPRILVVEHEADDPAHLIGTWLSEAGAHPVPVQPYRGEALPATLEGYDALLVMGGAMGAYDDDAHPWLAPTKQLIRDAVSRGVPMLGICLGHQLAAVALGGEVRRNPAGRQFGLLEVGWVGENDVLLDAVPRPSRGLHYNDDIVTSAPPGARVLARTADGRIQALRLGERAWSVQWHPEADAELVARWIDGDDSTGEPDGRQDGSQNADQNGRDLVADLTASAEESVRTWRPLATRFAEIAEAALIARTAEIAGAS